MLQLMVNYVSTMGASGWMALRWLLTVNRWTSPVIANQAWEIINLLLSSGAAAGVVVVVGLDGFVAFLEASLAHVCWGSAGRGRDVCGSHGGQR